MVGADNFPNRHFVRAPIQSSYPQPRSKTAWAALLGKSFHDLGPGHLDRSNNHRTDLVSFKHNRAKNRQLNGVLADPNFCGPALSRNMVVAV